MLRSEYDALVQRYADAVEGSVTEANVEASTVMRATRKQLVRAQAALDTARTEQEGMRRLNDDLTRSLTQARLATSVCVWDWTGQVWLV